MDTLFFVALQIKNQNFQDPLVGGRAVSKFGKLYQATFKEVLQMKHPVPSHVIFSDLTNRLDENQLIAAFNEWAKDYVPLQSGEQVSGDGKSLGSTVTNGANSQQTFSAIVSLFCQKSGLVKSLKQYANAKKSMLKICQIELNSPAPAGERRPANSQIRCKNLTVQSFLAGTTRFFYLSIVITAERYDQIFWICK